MLLMVLATVDGAAPERQELVRRTPQALVIEHVTVIDARGPREEPDMTVVVTGDRIEAVEPSEKASVPTGARRIDATGEFLIPGLWDMHVHPMRETDLGLFIANGVTGLRIMHGEPRFLEWRRLITRGQLLGPRLVIAGPVIDGPPPAGMEAVISTEGERVVRDAEEAKAEVRAQKAAGYDFIKVYNDVCRACYGEIVEEAARQGMPVAGHVPLEVGLIGALNSGQASVEHLRGYVRELVPSDAPLQPGADLRSRSLAWCYADASKMAALALLTRDAGAWNCPTLFVRITTHPRAEVERFLATPEAAYISPEGRDELRNRPGPLSNFSDEDFRLATEDEAVEDTMTRALRDAGAGLLAGTDQEPWGFSLHRELELLVHAGLTPGEALASATVNPATFLDAADLGSIERGKAADLVLLEADPLKDIANTRRIEAVVVNGRLVDRRSRLRLLEAARRAVNEK